MRVRQLGDPILRQVSLKIEADQINRDSTIQLIDDMQTVLDGIKGISDENGNAISAPQVGSLVRLILLRLDGIFVAMINPELTAKSEQTFEFEEECFSFYNLRGCVTRHLEVEVSYYDETGCRKRRTMRGEDAGLVQHEIDHLDGIFFVDRVSDIRQIYSVDYSLKDNPARLQQVKNMMAYMVG